MCPPQRFHGVSFRKLDLIAADLNRLQHRDIDRLIKIAAIAHGLICFILRTSDNNLS